jgi:hypothetical protein
LHFTDITTTSGIDMTITCGNLPTREILEVNGGGLALIDFDNDADLDLFVANGATFEQSDPPGGPGCRLFENIGRFKFRDITESAGIQVNRWATGVAVGDYDGDGFDDLYICCYGSNILLRNNGTPDASGFTDVTGRAFAEKSEVSDQKSDRIATDQPPTSDLRPLTSAPDWSTSAAFGDLDNAGDLDLYVCNYLEFDVNNRPARSEFKGVQVMGGPHGLTPQHDVLYRNHGDGTFIDVMKQSGCLPAKPAFGLNVLIIDFDGDGWQDITVANDSMPDFLFQNKGIEASRQGRLPQRSAGLATRDQVTTRLVMPRCLLP